MAKGKQTGQKGKQTWPKRLPNFATPFGRVAITPGRQKGAGGVERAAKTNHLFAQARQSELLNFSEAEAQWCQVGKNCVQHIRNFNSNLKTVF